LSFEEQVSEAVHTITSLWTLDLTREVAETGIFSEIAGEAVIVSSLDGAVLWRGGCLTLPWAVAFVVAAKKVNEGVQSSP